MYCWLISCNTFETKILIIFVNSFCFCFIDDIFAQKQLYQMQHRLFTLNLNLCWQLKFWMQTWSPTDDDSKSESERKALRDDHLWLWCRGELYFGDRGQNVQVKTHQILKKHNSDEFSKICLLKVPFRIKIKSAKWYFSFIDIFSILSIWKDWLNEVMCGLPNYDRPKKKETNNVFQHFYIISS